VSALIGAAVPAPGHGLTAPARSREELAERITARFPSVRTELAERGPLVVHVAASELVEVLTYCRDDEELACALLADLSAVHWPAGELVIERQRSTTGWPDYRVERELGMIEVLYTLRSVARNHLLRVVTATPDTAPRLPSVTGVFRTADFHEREVFDLFGVEFEGHPALTRILMPDDWAGHPQRKDYPLGGVDIPYANDAVVPPPDERDLRDVVR
jgi:NADH-quinone oxidoreductase subunit C